MKPTRLFSVSSLLGRWFFLWLLVSGVFTALQARAQCSLRENQADSRISAELYGGTEQGGFRPDYGSSSQWSFGARAEGVRHLKKVSFSGAFSFDQFFGSGMTGSMFFQPDLFPVDVLDFTPSDKSSQCYRLRGGLGVELGAGWILGGSVRFMSANYVKKKDIRHTTYAMDLDIEPTFAYRFKSGHFLQISYRHRKRVEQIKAEQLGSAKAESYYAFLNKGLSYGTLQLWDGDGLHLNEAGVNVFPVSQNADGGRLEWRKGGMALSLGGLWTKGQVGEKGYNWFRFPGWEAQADWRYDTGSDIWTVEAFSRSDRLEEAVMEKVSRNGVVIPVIYAYRSVSDRLLARLSVGWRHQWKAAKGQPLWTLCVHLEGAYRNGRSYLTYPYYDRLDLAFGQVWTQASVCVGDFEIQMGLSGKGGRAWEQGLRSIDPSVTPQEPDRLRDHEHCIIEYDTVPRSCLDAGFRWNIRQVKGLYLRADAAYERAFGVRFLPASWRAYASLGLGYSF